MVGLGRLWQGEMWQGQWWGKVLSGLVRHCLVWCGKVRGNAWPVGASFGGAGRCLEKQGKVRGYPRHGMTSFEMTGHGFINNLVIQNND